MAPHATTIQPLTPITPVRKDYDVKKFLLASLADFLGLSPRRRVWVVDDGAREMSWSRNCSMSIAPEYSHPTVISGPLSVLWVSFFGPFSLSLWQVEHLLFHTCALAFRSYLAPGLKATRTQGHRQKATASKGVFSGAYFNTFVKLTGIRKKSKKK